MIHRFSHANPASRTWIKDLSLFKSLNMRMYMLIVSLILLGGWHVTAQTAPTATPVVQPDERWVLKDYPQATNIRWHQEKKEALYECEFMDQGQERKIYFDYTGQPIRLRKEKKERMHRPEPTRRKDHSRDDDDADGDTH